MGAVATMIVRIGADVSDLTKGMDKATMAVAKASEKIMALGKSMTLYLTAPVAIAAYEFSKMAAEADSLGDRLDRVFGDKAQAMNDFLTELKKSVPESTMGMQKMAIEVQNLALNMGMSRDKAFEMSEGLLKMAGDAAAFAHIPMEEALQGFEKGLAGKTRGMQQFGMVIKLAYIQQEAYRLGLMKSGHALTALGIAEATYSLMKQQSSRFAGEAVRIQGEESVQFSMLKANFVDMAVKLGTLVLPAMITIVNALNDMMKGLQKVNPELLKFVLVAIGIAATVGPILMLVSGIGKLIVLIRGLVAVVSAASGIIGFLTALTAPEIIAGLALIAAGIAGIIWLIHKLKGEAKPEKGKGAGIADGMGTAAGAGGATSFTPGAFKTPFARLDEKAKAIAAEFAYAQARGLSVLTFYDQAAAAQEKLTGYAKRGADDVRTKAIAALRALQQVADAKIFQGKGLGKDTGQIWGLPAIDVIARFHEKVDLVGKAFKTTVDQGGNLAGVFDEAFQLASQLDDIIREQPNQIGEIAVAAKEAYEKLRPLLAAGETLGMTGGGGAGAGGTGSKGGVLTSQVTTAHPFNAQAQQALNYSQNTIKYFQDLNVRLLEVVPAFDSMKEATIAVRDAMRSFKQQTQLDWDKLKASWEAFKKALDDVKQTLITGFHAAILNVIITLQGLMQTVAQNLSTNIAHGSGAAGIGGQIGAAAGAAIGMAFGGPVGAAIGTAIGNIGGTIIGKELGKIGGFFGFGKSHPKTGQYSFQDLLNGMNFQATRAISAQHLHELEAQLKANLKLNMTLGTRIKAEQELLTVQQALHEALVGIVGLLNAPTGFRLALTRYNATGIGGEVIGSRMHPSSGQTFNGPVYIDARTKPIAQVLAELGAAQQQDSRRGGASMLALAMRGVA